MYNRAALMSTGSVGFFYQSSMGNAHSEDAGARMAQSCSRCQLDLCSVDQSKARPEVPVSIRGTPANEGLVEVARPQHPAVRRGVPSAAAAGAGQQTSEVGPSESTPRLSRTHPADDPPSGLTSRRFPVFPLAPAPCMLDREQQH